MSKEQRSCGPLSRRKVLKLGLVAGGSAMLPLETVKAKRRGRDRGNDNTSDSASDSGSSTPFTVVPWQEPLIFPNKLSLTLLTP